MFSALRSSPSSTYIQIYLFSVDRDEFCLGDTTFVAVDVGGHEQGI